MAAMRHHPTKDQEDAWREAVVRAPTTTTGTVVTEFAPSLLGQVFTIPVGTPPTSTDFAGRPRTVVTKALGLD